MCGKKGIENFLKEPESVKALHNCCCYCNSYYKPQIDINIEPLKSKNA